MLQMQGRRELLLDCSVLCCSSLPHPCASAQWPPALFYLLPTGLPMLMPGVFALQGWK